MYVYIYVINVMLWSYRILNISVNDSIYIYFIIKRVLLIRYLKLIFRLAAADHRQIKALDILSMKHKFIFLKHFLL